MYIQASDSTASEQGVDKGMFKVARILQTSGSLTVFYTLSGAASTDGTDYVSLSGSVIIPSGKDSANITLVPIDDSLKEKRETVKITLSANNTYDLSIASATVNIIDND